MTNSLAISGAHSRRRLSTPRANAGCGLGQRVGSLRTSAQRLLRLIRQHQPPAPPARSNSCPRGALTWWCNWPKLWENSATATTSSGWWNSSISNPRGGLSRPCLPSRLPHDDNSKNRPGNRVRYTYNTKLTVRPDRWRGPPGMRPSPNKTSSGG